MPTASKPDSKPSFSVLTVSKRVGWYDQAWRQVADQSARPYEWRIIQEGLRVIEVASGILSYMHYTIPVTTSVAPKKIRASNLNASLNYGLQQIHTDYVIFYQDFIDLPKFCFEKLLDYADFRTFVTTATINADGTNDNRYTGCRGPRKIRPEEWEANVAIAPMQIIRELGGFWPELDNGWAWDNVDLAQRAAMLGCKFLIDESNRPQLLEHEQTSKLKLTENGRRCADHIAAVRAGKAPLNVGAL